MQLTRVTPNTGPLLDVADLEEHCRITPGTEAGRLLAFEAAARAWMEEYCRRTLLTTRWRLSLYAFPPCTGKPIAQVVRLPRGPVTEVLSVQYVDADGTLVPLDTDDYVVSLDGLVARLLPAPGTEWPAAQETLDAVRVTYDAGWVTADAVPEPFKQAARLLVGHWYENREATLVGTISKELEFAVAALLGPYRLREVP